MNTEVYLDHARGLIAVAWPTRGGYIIYSDHDSARHVYALPAGMTRLQEPTPAPSSCATTRPLANVPEPRAGATTAKEISA